MRAGYYVYVSPNGQTFTTIADAPKHGKDDEQKGDGEEAASPAAGSSPLQSLKNYDQPDAAGAAGVKPGAQLKYPHLMVWTEALKGRAALCSVTFVIRRLKHFF